MSRPERSGRTMSRRARQRLLAGPADNRRRAARGEPGSPGSPRAPSSSRQIQVGQGEALKPDEAVVPSGWITSGTYCCAVSADAGPVTLDPCLEAVYQYGPPRAGPRPRESADRGNAACATRRRSPRRIRRVHRPRAIRSRRSAGSTPGPAQGAAERRGRFVLEREDQPPTADQLAGIGVASALAWRRWLLCCP